MSVEAGLDLGHVDDGPVPASPLAGTLRDKLIATGQSWGVRSLAVLIGLVLWYWAARIHLNFYIPNIRYHYRSVIPAPRPLLQCEALILSRSIDNIRLHVFYRADHLHGSARGVF